MSDLISKASPDWHGTREWLEEQIGKAHTALERCDISEKQTDQLRGEIRGYRHIIKAVEGNSHVKADPPPRYTT